MLDIYKGLGADGYSFEPLVGFGANCALGHHSPDNTVLKEGDTVLFDVGCRKDGYCADMTRTFFYKKVPSEKHRAIYETVRRANAAAEAILKPGVPLCEVDKLPARSSRMPDMVRTLPIGWDISSVWKYMSTAMFLLRTPRSLRLAISSPSNQVFM